MTCIQVLWYTESDEKISFQTCRENAQGSDQGFAA